MSFYQLVHQLVRNLWIYCLCLLCCIGQVQARSVGFTRVKAGEQWSMVAKRLGVGVSQLRRWNPNTSLRTGRSLRYYRAGVKIQSRHIAGASLKVVHVNLSDPDIQLKPILPSSGLGHGSSLGRLAARSGATAVINGGYFHPKSYALAGDLVVQGRYLAKGRIKTAVTISKQGRAKIRGQNSSWRGYQTVVATGPYLVQGGRVVIAPRREGYRDPRIWGVARRSAVALRSDYRLMLVSTQTAVSLPTMAKILRRLGARDAVLLDGGSSTGLIWQGRTVVRPQRMVAYGLGVFGR